MNSYEVVIGNLSFYINANCEEGANQQLDLIIAQFNAGSEAKLNGLWLEKKYLSESLPKWLLQ